MDANIYHSHRQIVGFAYQCKKCGALNIVADEYEPYVWEHCPKCHAINCVCPTSQDEQEQDRLHPTDSKYS